MTELLNPKSSDFLQYFSIPRQWFDCLFIGLPLFQFFLIEEHVWVERNGPPKVRKRNLRKK